MSNDLPSDPAPARELRLVFDGPMTFEALRRFVNKATNQGVHPATPLDYPPAPVGADPDLHALTLRYTPRQARPVGF